MWATVDLNQEIIDFIKNIENYTESFEEIQEIAFSKSMMKKNYSITDKINYSIMFQKIKNSAINKVMNNKSLNFPEGIVFERMLIKYCDEKLPSFDEHIKIISKYSKTVKNGKFRSIFELIKGVSV